MRKMLPDDFSAPREETGRRDQKTIWLVPGAQGKNPVGVVLGVSGGGATVWRVWGPREAEAELPPEQGSNSHLSLPLILLRAPSLSLVDLRL